ncbi:MAG: GIY-YIG nuclease family protein [Candidatus Doudnabacteria bacterium]|nr:GIY-YIG nuclease family protein [Candidatus Doudnabacteria bacterium]
MYIGFTNSLKKRLEEHRESRSCATEFRLPCQLIYFEGCLDERDARRREKYLKITQGRRSLGLRLIEFSRSQASGSGS